MSFKKTVLTALVFVALYNLLFYRIQPGIGIALLFLALNLFFFFNKGSNKNLIYALSSSSLAIFFAFLFSVRDNGIVQAINILTALFFSLISLYLYKYAGKLTFSIPNFILTPLLVMKDSVIGFIDAAKVENFPAKPVEKDVISAFIRGFLISAPVFIILFFLLTLGDPIFGKLSQNILSSSFLINIGERTVTSLIIFIILLGFGLAKVLENTLGQNEEIKIREGRVYELAIISGSILTLFALFIGVQLRYLFATVGERELHELGINSLTYSEYVRRGFFELLIASVIASGVIIYILKYLHKLKDRQKQIVQIFSSILTIETGLLLLSAVKRIVLYADAHGLTRARVFGFIFLVWLALILVVFLYKIFKDVKKEWFFRVTLTVTLLMFLLINLVNIDGLIATKYRPTVNDEVDYFYLTSLSTDAAFSWREAVNETGRIITDLEKGKELSVDDYRKLYWARGTLEKLNSQIEYLTNKYEIKKRWLSFNFSEYQAYQVIVSDKEFFGQIKIQIERINNLESRGSEEIKFRIPIDRSIRPPLVR